MNHTFCVYSYFDGHLVCFHVWTIGNSIIIPGSGRSPGEGNVYPLQCSCLENPMDRGAWQAMVLGAAQNQTRLKRLYFLFTLEKAEGSKQNFRTNLC